jgi:hypothetical protein
VGEIVVGWFQQQVTGVEVAGHGPLILDDLPHGLVDRSAAWTLVGQRLGHRKCLGVIGQRVGKSGSSAVNCRVCRTAHRSESADNGWCDSESIAWRSASPPARSAVCSGWAHILTHLPSLTSPLAAAQVW